jgi:hypothetical protein
MNMKKTLVLAAVLLAAFLYMKKVAIPSHEQDSKKEVIFAGLKPADLERIRVERTQPEASTREVFELHSRGETKAETASEAQDEHGTPSEDGGFEKLSWELAQFPGAVVDKKIVDPMISSIKALDVGSPIQDSELDKDFSVYGLDRPVLTVSVQRKGREPVEIAFGKRNEYLLKRYAKVSGRGGVFLVDDGSFAALNKGSTDVRSKTPIQFVDDDVRSVELSSPTGVVKLKQATVGEWKIVEPSELAASTVLVSDLLRSVRELRVVEFIDEPQAQPEKYGLGSPAVRLSLTMKEGSVPQSIEIALSEVAGVGDKASQASKAVYFQVSNVKTIFRAAIDSLSKFNKGEGDLRERRLFRLSADDIEKVRATGKGVPEVEIVATNTDWSVNGKRSDPSFVEQLLNDISGVQAVEFPTQRAADAFSETFLNLVITKKAEPKETITFTVGKEATSKSGAARWARVGDGGVPVLISDLEAKRIVPHEEALVEAAPPAQPTQVAIPTP